MLNNWGIGGHCQVAYVVYIGVCVGGWVSIGIRSENIALIRDDHH